MADQPTSPDAPETPETPETSEPTPSGVRRFPRLVYNPISLFGAALAVALLFAIFFLFVMDTTSETPNPYLGVVGFAMLPVPLVIGLLMIPFGMWLEWRREQKMGIAERRFPAIDLNRPDHRRALVTFVTGTIIFLFMTAAGSYKAYEYTESVPFCGTLCHAVMQPEHTTYLHGPHARVACVECHIGTGAEWYVRSKISGAYQIYSVLFHKYSQPIETPISNLRPARETCEQCHWPAQFHGDQMWKVHRYLPDEENTRWSIDMVMRTGGANTETGQVHGIHWHIAQKLEYVAADEKLQEIREVRFHRPDGSLEVFKSTDNPLSDDERKALPEKAIHTVDCMDCHNRPAHQFLSPNQSMDKLLDAGLIPSDLPYIKREGANLLAADYDSREAGVGAIDKGLRAFYAEQYPEIAKDRANDVDRAIAGVTQAFDTYFFPYMKARWSVYPMNIGHVTNPGCFRCHNANMQSAEGKVIRHDCELCHTILAQGPGTPEIMTQGEGGLEFKHPVDIGEAWKETPCAECHNGAPQ